MERVLLVAPAGVLGGTAGPATAEDAFRLSLQTRGEDGVPRVAHESWRAKQTAMIVCDMWDLHHCHNAVKREAETAPRMNEILEKARAMGVLIIHAPSGCMKAYQGHPARERARTTPKAAALPDKIGEWCSQIPAEKKGEHPIDQSDGGEDRDRGVGRRVSEWDGFGRRSFLAGACKPRVILV